MDLELIFIFCIGHVYDVFISKQHLDIKLTDIKSKSNFERFLESCEI